MQRVFFIPCLAKEQIQPKQHKTILIMRRDITIFFVFLCILQPFSTVYAQVTIGSDGVPNAGALLDLKEMASSNLITSTKGLNFPRVALEDPNRLEPCATTNATNNASHRGLVVYHTDNAVMAEGMYYWNGGSWRRLIDELPPAVDNDINLQNLRTNSTTEGGGSNGAGGTVLDFGQVVIPENGSYAFNFRFYGSIDGMVVDPIRCVYYLSVWADGEDIPRDIAEINIIVHRNTSLLCTYSVALGAYFRAGENVTFRMSHMSTAPYPWTLRSGNTAARTSMIWWRL